MYRFFKGIPLAFLEAARLDGAGELKLFFIVAIPLGSPGVISAIVLGFLEYWNLIEQPMAFLKTKELWPLSLYLPNIELEQAGFAFAASVVALAPADSGIFVRTGLPGAGNCLYGGKRIKRETTGK